VPQEDCETAAISLGLGDTSVYVGTDPSSYAVRPPGCIYDGSSNLRFNTLDTSLNCGSAVHDCVCGAVYYTLISSGTCLSNSRYEVPQEDCETAAISLGLSDTGVDLNEYSARPPGCIYVTRPDSSDVLRFNTLETSVTSCGSGDYNYDCICGALAPPTPAPPTDTPTKTPTLAPSESPTPTPTETPTESPTESPTKSPTESTPVPSESPTAVPTPGASCSDELMNGDETDVDCGGPSCDRCGIGKLCLSSDDCAGSVCSNGEEGAGTNRGM
jgi:hypothetical protein